MPVLLNGELYQLSEEWCILGGLEAGSDSLAPNHTNGE